MTSWIVAIDRNYPQHWRIAVTHGFWDMTQERPVEAGDDVFFWQASKSLVGHVRATSDAHLSVMGTGSPWDDAAVRRYRCRFDFDLVSTTPKSQPRWVEVSEATGIRQSLQSGVVSTRDPKAEAWLARQF